ncbi:flagellar filament capping protein FliD [Actinomadura hibisca]|uniref:flagellar filament capping protein FliD n=1 Tax=Actinomadura hibisca TaxID=68565 RepID=UPI00082C1760|nr:flagellar filament capping protein FliD [Actinomadura hibisca]
MTSGVDGLISGMDTTALISQLMQAESAPQQQLKNSVTSNQSAISAYQSINGKFLTALTAAKAMSGDDPLTAPTNAWRSAKATSTSSTVTATATAGATPGTLTFNVDRLAAAQMSTSVVNPAGPLTTGSGLDITVGGGTPVHVNVTTDTPQGVADAINAAGVGVRASIVTTDQGTVLQLNAAKTGTAGGFTVGGLATPPTTAVQAADARITVGDPTKGGYTVSSPTNTFSGVLQNVTLTVSKVETGASVTVDSDADGIAGKMQAMVDALNGVLSEIGKYATYNTATKTGGPLTADSLTRGLQQKILSQISNGAAGYGSFSKLGVELDQGGKLTFDKTAFVSAYQADPAAVEKTAGALAVAVKGVAEKVTNSTDGSLTQAIKGRTDTVRDLNNRISEWDVRLSARQAALQKQFATLETTLGKLKEQSNWLSGQISSLPSAS